MLSLSRPSSLSRLPSRLSPVLVVLPLLGLLGGAGDANAQNQTQNRQLVLDIELQRQGPVQLGADQGSQKLSQRWQLSAMLQSDGTRYPYNPLDPQDHRLQMERAQQAVQAQQTQKAQQARQTASRAAPSSTPSTPADLQAMQAQAQTLLARCGQDQACLMREAATLSSATVARGDPAVQAKLQAYGHAVAACERQPAGRARETCQAEARRQAGGGTESFQDEQLPTPYLIFTGSPACGLQVQGKLDDRIDGSFGDVQGQVRYVESTSGSETRRDNVPCPSLQAVLDTRNGRVWTALGMVPQQVQGVHVREETGRRAQRSEGPQSLNWHEAQDWLQQLMSKLSAEGRDEARFSVRGGQTEIRMRWSFKPA